MLYYLTPHMFHDQCYMINVTFCYLHAFTILDMNMSKI